jgi:hypothetical protein
MAEPEEDYLRRGLEENICPVCRSSITEKFGSGQFKDGVFCSLECYGKWHQESLKRRHQDRVKKGSSDE